MPRSCASFCSWQFRFLAQVRQLFGWSDKSSSTIVLLAFMARGDSVFMSMPSLTGVAQDGSSLPLLTSSTIQTLHEASLFTNFISCKSMWQSVGIFTPMVLAASSIEVLSATETSTPLIFKFIILAISTS